MLAFIQRAVERTNSPVSALRLHTKKIGYSETARRMLSLFFLVFCTLSDVIYVVHLKFSMKNTVFKQLQSRMARGREMWCCKELMLSGRSNEMENEQTTNKWQKISEPSKNEKLKNALSVILTSPESIILGKTLFLKVETFCFMSWTTC